MYDTAEGGGGEAEERSPEGANVDGWLKRDSEGSSDLEVICDGEV